MEYYETTGSAVAILNWERQENIQACDPEGKNVFCASYFNNIELNGKATFQNRETEINHPWGWNGPGYGLENDYFSVRWEGLFEFDGRLHNLNVTTDDGMRIWIGDELVIDAWKTQEATNYSTVIQPFGVQKVKIEYFDQQFKAIAQVSWTPVPSLYDFDSSIPKSPIGTNISGLSYWINSWALVDEMKRGSPWVPQCNPYRSSNCSNGWNTGEQDLIQLDRHGWPRTLPDGSDPNIQFQWLATLMFQGRMGHYPAGQYTVMYDSEGTIEYSFDAVKNHNLSIPGKDILEVEPSNHGILLKITETDPAKAGNYIRNIRVIWPGGICDNDLFHYAENPEDCKQNFTPFTQNYRRQVFHPNYLKDLKPFDAIRYHFLLRGDTSPESWNERSRPRDVFWTQETGAPIELAIKLSNQLESDAWLTMPVKVDDVFIQRYARLVLRRLKPDRKVYIEYGNEIWNNAWPFSINGEWIQQRGIEEWPERDAEDPSGFIRRLNWYAKRSVEICNLWKSAWGNQSHRIQCVLSGQAANAWNTRQILDCPYWAESHDGQPCSKSVDGLAIAPYFGEFLGRSSLETQMEEWSRQGETGLNWLFFELSGINFSGHETIAPLFDPHEPLPWNQTPFRGALALAFKHIEDHFFLSDQHDLKLLAYEGGQHLVGIGPVVSNQAITDLFIAANRDPRMGEIYRRYLEGWSQRGGELMMNFNDIGLYSRWGSWGAKEFPGQNDAPKMDALLDYIGTD